MKENNISDVQKNEKKTQFIEMRAKGYPYSIIAKEINVSKATLTTWNKELKDKITELKAEKLNELFESYYMLREARIKQLGDTLKNINTALEGKNLSDLSPDKLLDYKLKFINELKDELVEFQETKISTNLNADEIIGELVSVLERLRNGDITKDQALKENYIISSILKAHEALNLERKIDILLEIVKERKA